MKNGHVKSGKSFKMCGLKLFFYVQICLMSRDEQSILVVSYQELKHCLEQSFGDLLAAATNKPDIL